MKSLHPQKHADHLAPVSVILPTYNRRSTLWRALSSVLEQTLKPREMIIVDDGSTDDTFSWLQSIQSDFNGPTQIKIWRQDNSGVSRARNQGIRLATSEWIAFLDSDDEWLPHKLSAQIERAQLSGLKVIHGDEIWIRHGHRVNPKLKHKKSGGYIFDNCLKLCLISPSCVLLHRSVLDHVGLFREDFPACEDYDLWLRLTSQYHVGFVATPLIKKYGGHADQLSRKYIAMDYWRILALDHLLRAPHLTQSQRQATRKELAIKCEILLKGALKHGRTQLHHQVQDIYRSHELKRSSIRAQALSMAHSP